MILDISPHNLAEPDLSISSRGAFWGGGANRFTAYTSYSIELKFGKIYTFVPHNRSKSHLPISPKSAVEARLLNLQIDSQPTVFIRLR